MRVAVITPYYRETAAVLQRAHDSVCRQTLAGGSAGADLVSSSPEKPSPEQGAPATVTAPGNIAVQHVLIADGHPQARVDAWNATHLILPHSHGDNGNTPRHVGCVWARDQGYDAVAFLDADNWYDPEHLAGLLALHHNTGAPVVSARRRIWSLDGRLLLAEGEPPDGLGHNDTSTLLVTRAAFPLLDLWQSMPKALTPICDTVFFYAALFRDYAHQYTPAVTVNFQSHYKDHYYRALVPAPDDNRVENSFWTAYGHFIRSSAETMAAVYLGLPENTGESLPETGCGVRFARFGAELFVRDKSGDGLKYLQRAVDLLPDIAAPANNLAAALARRGRHDEARPLLLQARAQDPDNPAIRHNLGLSCLMAGDLVAGTTLMAEAAPALAAALHQPGGPRLAGLGYIVLPIPADGVTTNRSMDYTNGPKD